MKTIKVVLNEDGSMQPVKIDFKVYRGEYNQVELMIYIPKSLLLDTVTDENGNLLTGNIVKVGAIIHKANGQAYTTQDYIIPVQEEQTIDDIKYAIYCRRLPKVFTLWDTVATELGERGELQMVLNLLQMRQENNKTIVESILTSPIVSLPVYPSVYLSVDEAMETDKIDELAGNIDTLRVIMQNDMATKLELEEVDTNKVDKVQAEADKVLLSNGDGGIQVSNVTIHEYEDQKGYIDQLHSEQEQRMDRMQEEITTNTKERHVHINKEILDGYTVENNTLLESVDKMHEHRDLELLNATTEPFTVELKGEIANAFTHVSIDGKTGIFTFTKNNGEEVRVDTLLEKVIVNFRFDKERQALILISEDGTEQEVELGALLSLYKGTDGAEITVTVDRSNNIGASIKEFGVTEGKIGDYAVTDRKIGNGAVTEIKLHQTIVDKLSNIVSAREIVDLIYPIGIILEFGEEFDPNAKWNFTEWKRIENCFTYASGDKQVGDTGGEEEHRLTVEELAEHNHTQEEHNHGVTADRKYGGNGSGDWNWSGWDNGDRGGRNQQTISTDNRRPAIHSTGGNKPHNNMPPYLVVGKWQRIK